MSEQEFQEWWDKYHASYYDMRAEDVAPWYVKQVARQAWKEATHAEFMRRMDREMQRAKETENDVL